MSRRTMFMLLVTANVLCYCVLGFYQSGEAQTESRPRLANPVQERIEMISSLHEIRDLLKEQNSLLRSGQVKVIVT
jgi:hypothetical protein